MVAGDGDDDDEHQDEQPAGHGTHNDHQHVFHYWLSFLRFCEFRVRREAAFRRACKCILTVYVIMTSLSDVDSAVVYLSH